MVVDILKFVGVLTIMAMVELYIPYGRYLTCLLIAYALWKLVNT